jgi:hypothetical protein
MSAERSGYPAVLRSGKKRRMDSAHVSLLRWLRRQLRQPMPEREHLEAAVANDDPDEARRLLAGAPFSRAQRRYVDDVLRAWEREKAGRR